MKRVLVVGEINVDLILRGYTRFPAPGREVLVDDFETTLGSASAILAVGLSRLGTPVAFLGKIGADDFGRLCVTTMSAAGVDTTRVVTDPAIKTGLTVSLTSSADRALITYPGSIGALTGADVPDAALMGFAHLHVSSYYLQAGLRPALAGVIARATALGLSVSLDPGFDPDERWDGGLLRALRHVDVFLPNQVELAALTRHSDPEAGLRALAGTASRTVVKLGPRGAASLVDDALVEVSSPAVTPVDTTGAGDSFNAGFLHAWLRGMAIRDCLRYGTACGALSTRGLGGVSAQPDGGEVERLLSGSPA